MVGKIPERPARPGNEGNANRPPQPAVPTLNIEITTPLKYLSNFWRFLDLTLINCEIELDLSWRKNCVLIEHNNNVTGVNFMITSTKLYGPVVTLSINDKNIKQGFKRTISWNKYRSELTTQTKNNNLDYLIDITFMNINRLFVHLFKNGNVGPSRNSFDEDYMLLVEIKDFNALMLINHFLTSQ